MRYRLRRLASVLTALTILVGLPVGGGAWLSSSKMTTPGSAITAVTPDGAMLATSTSVSATGNREAGAYPAVPDVREPDPGGSVIDWLCTVDDGHERCRPVKIGAAIPEAAAEESSGSTQASSTSTQPSPAAPEPATPLSETAPPRAPTLQRLVPLDPQSAEDWRPLIEMFFFPADADRAVDIVRCESQGQPDAKNPRSTASGLFQHLASLWPERATNAGYPGADVFDPVANTAVAAWLAYEGGGWSHWNASRDCWG